MQILNFNNAYYIKLGRKAKWAKKCIENGIIRIGWDVIKNIDDLNNRNWNKVKSLIEDEFQRERKKNGATQDFNALKNFCEATENDVFITFHKGEFYWCNPMDGPIEIDSEGKYRKTKNGWKNTPINDRKKILRTNEISGKISKTQAFQATLCTYKDKDDKKIIHRIINGLPNPIIEKIKQHKSDILIQIEELIKNLHWKDCEILTDLVFQQSGWQRISMQGGSMEFLDMEYLEPITNYRYAVQVKSGASLTDVKKYQKKLEGRNFEKMFFVVFNPDKTLIDFNQSLNKPNFKVLFRKELAEYIIDLGLLNWLINKSS